MFVNFLVWLAFWLLVAIVRPPEAASIAVLERASNGNGVPSRQPSKDAAGMMQLAWGKQIEALSETRMIIR